MHNFSLISPAGLHGVIRGAKRVIQVFVLLGLLLLSIAAVAESGQVSGKAADPHHAVISGAKVALTNRLTKKTVTVLTSDQGTYNFSALSAGTYELRVQAKGFRSILKSGLQISDGIATQDFTLEVETRVETVDVNSPRPLIGQDVNAQGTKDYVIDHSTTGTKADLPDSWVPQDIVVVSPKLIDDQNLRSIVDTMKDVSGVSSSYPAYFTLDLESDIIIRGFPVSTTLRDGLWDAESNGNIGWMGDVDHVEVLKGPAGLEFGSYYGGIGGVVNVVTKKPLTEARYALKTNTDSYGSWGVSGDFSQPFGSAKNWLARANLNIGDTQLFANRADSYKRDGSVIVQGLLTSNDAVTMSYDRRWQLAHPYSGLPGYALQGSNGLQPLGSYGLALNVFSPISQYTYNAHDGRAAYEHRFGRNWKLHSSGQVIRVGRLTKDIYATPTWSGTVAKYTEGYSEIHMGPVLTWDADTMLEGRFSTSGVQHVLIGGYRYAKNGYDMNMYRGTGISGTNSFSNPEAPTWETATGSARYVWGLASQHQHDIYVNDIAAITRKLRMTAGVNYVPSYQQLSGMAMNPAMVAKNTSGFHGSSEAWRVGVLYDVLHDTTVFADYSTTFQPNAPNITTASSTLPSITQNFAPTTGDQFEVGIKSKLGNRASVTAVYYQIKMKNEVMKNPDPTLNSLGYEASVNGQGSRGVELDGTYRLPNHWNLLTAYAFTNVRITDDSVYLVGSTRPDVPKESLRLWCTHEFTEGPVSGLEVGGGIHGVSQRTTNLVTQASPALLEKMPAYGVVDVMASYHFAHRYKVSLNVGNIFNHRYWESSNNGSYSYLFPGEPANVTLRVQGAF